VEVVWIVIGGLIAFFVAWNNGANNAADAIGTAVGSRAIDLRKALVIAAVADFVGAILFGSFVSETIMRGIVDIGLIANPKIIIYGMLSTLLATGLWMLLASILKMPMSISMAIVGAVMGFGLVTLGVRGVLWDTIAYIFMSWTILPFFSAAIAILLQKFYSGMLFNIRLLPYAGASSLFIIVFSTSFLLLYGKVFKTYSNVLILSLLLGIASFLIFLVLINILVMKRGGIDKASNTILKILVTFAAATIAFSHGANDVAKSAAPLTAIILASSKGYIPLTVSVDTYALVLCASGIAIGIISWGYRVVGTLGEEITTLTYTSAFIAQISASIPLLIFTRLGMPVSTTMSIVGAIAGVGLAKGVKYVNIKTLLRIFSTWIIAVPVVMVMSAGIYFLISFIV